MNISYLAYDPSQRSINRRKQFSKSLIGSAGFLYWTDFLGLGPWTANASTAAVEK